MKVSYLNPPYADLNFENQILRETGVNLVPAIVNRPDETGEAAWDADGIVTAVVPIGPAVVNQLQRCKVIVRLGVGYDIVDLESCKRRGITVCNIPDYGTEEVAVHAMALLFAVHRRITLYDRTVRNQQWGHLLPWPIHRLSNLQAGVIGLGRIGSTFARLITPFVRGVAGYDPFVPDQEFQTKGIQRLSLDALLENCDVLSLHLPLTRENHHLISDEAISKMKRRPILINVSRGGLVEGAALARALKNGQLSGAGVDVFENEPRVLPELLALENIVLSPHVAWYSEESEHQLRRSAMEEILRVLRGERPKNPVV